MQLVQNFGAMAILALMVLKSPSIISALSEMIDKNISTIRATQTEALNVFKSENDKVLALISDRFKVMEDSLRALMDATSKMASALTVLNERVTQLEQPR